MIETARLDIPDFLSEDATKCDLCLHRFSEFGSGLTGVSGLHLNSRRRTAILHFDPSVTSLDRVEVAMRGEGKRLDSTYDHLIVPVQGMDCTDCALTIERSVQRMRGVQTASVNFASARLAFEYDRRQTNLRTVAKRVSDLGYRVDTEEKRPDSQRRQGFLGHLLAPELRLILAAAILAICGGVWSVARLPSVGIAVPILAGLAMLTAGIPVARRGVVSLVTTRRLDINILMAIALVGAAALGEWLEGATLVVLFSAGEALEGYTMDRARQSIQSLMKLAPSFALVRHGDHEHRVPVEQLSVGDTILIRSGDRIPVDGTVVEGTSTLDQSPVTGESVPVNAAVDTPVYSGSINGSGVLAVRVDRPAGDSTIARIIKLVQQAQAQKAPTQRFIDRFATYYTPIIVAIAILVALVPPLMFGLGWADWIGRALVLLVIACPCALVISTPVSIVSALSAAARSGVLIKGGAALEATGSLRAVAFDKTGTLTTGRLSVTSIQPLDDAYTSDQLLRLAAAAERFADHPIARA
ncbi:MAG TPA: cation-translocating P-type ATPase, partial [Thermomicrobiaceae bacterium]|nr:cation-translocating P-type ATPase [Thermomicrobiaceae bacterium]